MPSLGSYGLPFKPEFSVLPIAMTWITFGGLLVLLVSRIATVLRSPKTLLKGFDIYSCTPELRENNTKLENLFGRAVWKEQFVWVYSCWPTTRATAKGVSLQRGKFTSQITSRGVGYYTPRRHRCLHPPCRCISVHPAINALACQRTSDFHQWERPLSRLRIQFRKTSLEHHTGYSGRYCWLCGNKD